MALDKAAAEAERRLIFESVSAHQSEVALEQRGTIIDNDDLHELTVENVCFDSGRFLKVVAVFDGAPGVPTALPSGLQIITQTHQQQLRGASDAALWRKIRFPALPGAVRQPEGGGPELPTTRCRQFRQENADGSLAGAAVLAAVRRLRGQPAAPRRARPPGRARALQNRVAQQGEALRGTPWGEEDRGELRPAAHHSTTLRRVPPGPALHACTKRLVRSHPPTHPPPHTHTHSRARAHSHAQAHSCTAHLRRSASRRSSCVSTAIICAATSTALRGRRRQAGSPSWPAFLRSL